MHPICNRGYGAFGLKISREDQTTAATTEECSSCSANLWKGRSEGLLLSQRILSQQKQPAMPSPTHFTVNNAIYHQADSTRESPKTTQKGSSLSHCFVERLRRLDLMNKIALSATGLVLAVCLSQYLWRTYLCCKSRRRRARRNAEILLASLRRQNLLY